MIRILVVDDSRLARTLLREILESDPELRVVAEAENGAQAVVKCVALEPDLVLMDIQMPGMGGLEAVEQIMRERPTPVIVLSATVNPGEVKSAFRAVRAGAFEALPKPQGVTSRENYERLAGDLISRVKLYARAGQHRQWGERSNIGPLAREIDMPAASRRVVAMGASTGGPRTVQAILAALPADFPCPILLVQHIGLGFTRGFAQWLQREIPFETRVVEGPERPQRGTVYLASEGNHLKVLRGMAVVSNDPPVNSCRPSADVLFRSVAEECGSRAVAVVLTGMGKDGAAGALAVRKAGGTVLVQDESSSVIYGMPKAALELGAATRVVPDREVSSALVEAIRGPNGLTSE